MQLTSRAEEIIRILLRFPQNSPVTTSILSEELGISSRSIQRELLTVEQWLSSQGFRFIRKRSVGLILDEPENRRQELLTLLNQNQTPGIAVEDRRQRQELLRHDLLFTGEPVKSFDLASRFGISEGTLSADLNQLTPWFETYQLQLIRRPGLGIFLKGDELSLRQAITSHLCSRIAKASPHTALLKSKRSANFVHGLEDRIVLDVHHVLADSKHQLHLQLSDSSYLHLLIYLSVSLSRTAKGNAIEHTPKSYPSLKMEPEYAVAEYLMNQLQKCCHLPCSEKEKNCLAAYLTGLHLWPLEFRDLTTNRDFSIHQVTLALINRVGELLDIDFGNDSRLPRELGSHLQPAIGRLRAGIPIENPMLEEFQQNYRTVYEACKKAAEVLQDMFHIPKVYESEIGFITVYFVMALERKTKRDRKLSVILVCPTGIGSSKLLASSLQKEYPDLQIRGTMSAFELNEETLPNQGADLIISTVKLDPAFCAVTVSPLLTRQDKMLLNARLKLIQQQRSQQEILSDPPIPENILTREDVEYISALGSEIYHLLGNIRLGQAPVLQNRQEILSCGAALFADEPGLEKHFLELLSNRDQMADTYMKPFYALLLHGRSDRIQHPCFGYIQLDPPVYENTRVILGAIVSLIPDGANRRIAAPIVSEIVGALLEDPELLKALRSMDQERFTCLLETSLLRFYRQTVQTRLKLIPNREK